EDFGLLLARLLPQVAPARPALWLQRAAARALLLYDWPYNVRELEQVLARAATVLESEELRLADLPAEIARAAEAVDGAAGPAPGSADERDRLLYLLRQHGGNLSAVARALRTSRSQLRRILARHDMDPGEFREG